MQREHVESVRRDRRTGDREALDLVARVPRAPAVLEVGARGGRNRPLADGADEAATCPRLPVPVVSADGSGRSWRRPRARHASSRRDTALLLTRFDTGVRPGELVGMRMEDIDLKDRLVYVTGKGGNTRAVRFGTKTAVAIDRYLRLRRGHRLAGVRGALDRPGRPDRRRRASPRYSRSVRRGRAPTAPPAPVPPHVRAPVPRRWRAGRRPAATRRLALTADAPTLRREPRRRARESRVSQPGRPAMNLLCNGCRRELATLTIIRREIDPRIPPVGTGFRLQLEPGFTNARGRHPSDVPWYVPHSNPSWRSPRARHAAGDHLPLRAHDSVRSGRQSATISTAHRC